MHKNECTIRTRCVRIVVIPRSDNAVSKYEKSERNIPIEIILKYADYFNVTTDYLFGLTDEKD